MKTNLTTTCLIILTGFLSSCGMQKHTAKQTALSETHRKIDSTSMKSIHEQENLKRTEVITESADTSTVLPEWMITGSSRRGPVALPGGGSISFNVDDQDSFKITMPAKAVVFRYARRIEKQEESLHTTVTDSRVRIEKKETSKAKTIIAGKTSLFSLRLPWWMWALGLIVVITTGIGIYRKMQRRFGAVP